jgi:RHS repeat-associated protein
MPGVITNTGIYTYKAEVNGTNSSRVCPTVTDLVATVTITVSSFPPIINSQPASQTVGVGSNATFTVSATGCPSWSYQWWFNVTNSLNGATNATLTLTNVQSTNAGSYFVTVTDPSGSTNSIAAILNVSSAATAPMITQQPVNVTTNAGGSATFSVTVSPNSTPPLFYQWQKNGSNLTNSGKVSGANSNTLTLTNLSLSDAGIYNIVVTNAVGRVASLYAALRVWTPSGVVGWGYDYAGQTDIPAGLTNVVDISGGLVFSLALKNDGTVVAWGYGGDGETNVPSGLTNVVAIAAGGYQGLALKGDGTMAAWGYGTNYSDHDSYGQALVPAGLTNVVAIAAGVYHNLALKNDGTVVAWGDNDFGETNVPWGLTNVVAIAAGEYHSLALKGDGTVVAWGDDTYGETNVPTGLANVTAISGGYEFSLALSGGSVDCWGTAPNVPPNLVVQQNVIAIDAGAYYGLALTSGGTMVGWGDNTYGETNVPAGLTNVVKISAGGWYSLALGYLAPVIVTQPTNTTVTYGQAAVFSVQASGTAPLQYQWLRSGTNIPGATASFYFVSQPQVADSGTVYSVIVSNAWGTATSSNATLTVVKAPLTIRADNKARIYGQTNPPLTWSALGLVYGDGTNVLTVAPVLSATASNTSPAGNYTITITNGTLSASNYVITFANGILTVVQAPLVVTALNNARVYGATNPALAWTFSGFVNGETTNVLSGVPLLTTGATNTSGVGTYPIVITVGTLSATNYAFGFVNGTLTVTPAALTVTANSTNQVYGAASPVFTATYTGFVNGDTANVLGGSPSLTTTVVSNSPAGSYSISAAVGTLTSANYNFTAFTNGTLTITPANLNVTANNITNYVGATNPVLSYTISGFVAGDGTNIISGAPVLSTASSTNSAGTYIITNAIGTLAATNHSYNFVLSNGVLTILPASSTITFSNSVMNYLIGAPPMVMDGNMTVATNGAASFGNAQLTASFTYGESGDYLSVLNLGTAPGQVAVTNAGSGSADACRILYGTGTGTTNIGTFTPGTPTNALVVHFGTNATLAHVQAVARNLTYYSTSTSPSGNPRHVTCCCTTTNPPPTGPITSPPTTDTIYTPCPTNIYAVLIIDRTPSMGTKDVGTTNIYGSNRLAAAKFAAITFLNYLQFPTDEVQVIDFTASPTNKNPVTNPVDLTTNFLNNELVISNCIATINTNPALDGTIYYPSLTAAYTNLAGITNPLTLRLTIFLSDGEENGTNYGIPNSIQLALNETHAMATNGTPAIPGIRLITIGLGGEVSSNDATAIAARSLLSAMASSTNDFHVSTNGTGLTAVYTALATSICRVTNLPPIVYAGPDTTNVFTTLPGVVNLAGDSYDQDDLPRGIETNCWTVVSNPPGATVNFANAAVTNTPATFTLPGVYTLQLLASDTALSVTDTVNITIRERPSIAITNPALNAVFLPNTNILIQASASSPDGGVTQVEFFHGDISLGVDPSPPYSMIWSNVPPGNYALTAVATDIHGLTNVSSTIYITVLGPPTIYIATPTAGAIFNAPATISLTSVVRDTDGVVTDVDYYTNGAWCGRSTTSPVYPLVLTNVPGGPNQLQLTAVARDNNGVNATSAPVNVMVYLQPPVVYLTTPQSNAVFSLGEPIVIQANATDADGWIANLAILTNGVQSSAVAANSITVNWTNAPAGLNQISALAVDNYGLSATAVVPISVQGCVPPGVSNPVLSVNTILGGGQLTGTVILSNTATTGGQAVNLYTTSPNVTLPSYVLIPQGQSSNSFPISTVSVTATNTVTISAAYHGQTSGNVVLNVLPSGAAGAMETAVRPGFDANIVAATGNEGYQGYPGDDDGTLGPVNIGFPTTFYCQAYSNLWINMNGIITFVEGYNEFTPYSKISEIRSSGGYYSSYGTPLPAIAPFWADVDPGGTYNAATGSGTLRYGTNMIDGHPAFGATWDNVGYYCSENDKTNRFQVVLIDRSDTGEGNFDIEFNYERIQWDTGDFSGGIDGLGSLGDEAGEYAYPARFGFGNGQGDGFELPGSGITNAFLDTNPQGLIHNSYNSTVPGRYIFPIRCNSSGPEVFVRDDETFTNSSFAISSPGLGAGSVQNSIFDTRAIIGNVLQMYLQRCGAIQHIGGAQMDLELGVASVQGPANSFGLLWSPFQTIASPTNYLADWALSADFNADLQNQLNSDYQVQLTNRLSSVCGNVYTVTDTPNINWPVNRNILTFEVATDRSVPQKRCRSFILDTSDAPPLNGEWDILLFDQIIASSGNLNGWNVEEDHTIFNGFTITAPESAVVSGGYELRVCQPGWLIARSVRFSVAPQGTLNSAPVLLPLMLSTNTITASTTVALTVVLDAPSPFGGAYVTLSTNGLGGCVVPQWVVIPAGQTSVTANIQVNGGTAGALEILAEYNGYRQATVQAISSSCSAPYPPPNPSADPYTIPGSVLVTWNAVPTATSYSISRGLNNANFISLFTGLITNQFVDTTVLPGNSYTYIVTAFTNLCFSTGTSSVATPFNGPAPAPWIIPSGGIFNDSVNVLLTNYVQGAVMYYSTNGSPYNNLTGSFVNSGVISLTNSATIEAYTSQNLNNGYGYGSDSSMVSANFVIVHPTPIACGYNQPGALTTTNANSTVAPPGWFCQRYRFDATGIVGEQVTVTATSTDFYSVLVIEDTSSNILAWNDNYYPGDSPDNQIVFPIVNGGVYIIEVTSDGPEETGNFTLQLNCAYVTSAILNVFTNAYTDGNTVFTTNTAPLPIGGLIDFGTISASTPVTNWVTLTNSGNGNLVISNIIIAPAALTNGGNGFSISPTGTITLLPGGITNLAVSLYATNWSDFGGYFTFECNDAGTGTGSAQNFYYAYVSGQVSQPVGLPWIYIYYPTNGMVVPVTNSVITNVTLEIDAVAMDMSGITSVAFYTNYSGAPYQTLTSASGGIYTVFWTNPPAGQQTITAKAYDSLGYSSVTNVTIMVGTPTLTLSSSNGCVGLSNTTFTVTATLLNATNGPVSNSNVVFTVTGAHTISYTTTTALNGQASFTYTGTNAGLDTIVATAASGSIAVQSQPVLKNWALNIGCGNTFYGSLSVTDGSSIACGCAVPSHYTDFYSFTGTAGEILTFTMHSTNFSTFMFLMYTNCVSLTVTNEMLNLTDVQLGVSLPSNGTYFVEATSAGTFQTGNYSLSVTCGVPPTAAVMTVWVNGTNLSNGGLINLGTTTNGTPLTQAIGITNIGTAPLNITSSSWYYGLTNVFSVSPSPITSLPAGSGAVYTLEFLATNSGQYVDALVLTNNDPYRNPFGINLNAISMLSGTPPTVSLIAPTNNAWYVSPATINLQATATSASGAAITNVMFVYQTSQGTYLIGNDTQPPYAATWGMSTPGNYNLLAVAYDNQGRIAVSSPVTNVQVRPSTQNLPPKANTDIVTVLCNSHNNVLNLLTNDTDPNGYPLTIVNYKLSSSPGPHGTVAIVNNGKNISYTPMPGYGTNDPTFIEDGFSYEISNGHPGGTNWGGVLVIIYATELPQITITNPPAGTTLYSGTTTNVTVSILPPDVLTNIVEVQYWVNGDEVGDVTNAPFTVFPWYVRTDPCGCGLVAAAIDKFGQRGVSPAVHYTIKPPPGSSVPYAQIDSPSELPQSPQAGNIERNAVVTDGMLVVTGTVYQEAPGSNTPQAAQYKVVIEASDGTVLRDSGWQTAALIQHGPIYTNDLTTLQNDDYSVILYVRNDYQTADAEVPFILDSALKLGVFTFSAQDLVVPAGGTPLSVVRTYNSMNPNLGDFGYSWTYSLEDLDVTFHEDRAPVYPDQDDIDEEGPAYNGAYFSLCVGGSRDVTLTLPNGQRTTFYYYEEQVGYNEADPYYYSPPGAHAQLTPVDANGNYIGGYNLFWAPYVWTLPGGETPNDNFEIPAFLLTLDDGTQYFIVRGYQGAFEDLGLGGGGLQAGSGYYYQAYTDQARVAWIKLPSGEKIVINAPTAGPAGNQFSINYLNVTNQIIRSIYFQRNANGQISAIMDPASGPNGLPVVQYVYDYNTNLIQVLKLVDRNNQIYTTNTYFYENGSFPHFLTRMLDARGVVMARNLYDDSGKLIGVIDAAGNTNLFVYNTSGNSETVFDRMGNPSTYVYDTRGNVTTEIDALNHVTQNTYDDQNNLTSTTDPLNNTTYYAYDGNGNRTQVVDPLGHTNLFSYDANNNLLTQTNPVGNVLQNQYNSGNLTATIHYDALGNVVQQSSFTYVNGQLSQTFDGNGNVTASFGYDGSGNVTSTTNANGFSCGFTYDANGNQTSASYVGKKLDGTSVTIATTNVYDAAGRVTMTIDANGNTNQTFYNSIGQVDHTVDQFGNTNSNIYDARGNLIQTISPFGTNCTVFDDNARPVLATDPNGISGTLTQYDPVGRVTSTIRATNVVVNIEPDPNNPGQYMSVIVSAGTPYSTNSTAYYANGWVQSRTTPDGHTTSYQYWADGQTMNVTDPLNHQTSYFYDAAGRQSQVWDALNHPTQFGYDALGRQVATIFADGSSVTNQFNNVGQRVGQIDQAGLRTQFGYNVSGLLTNVLKPQVLNPLNSQMVAPQWNYQYDGQGHLLVTTDANGHSTTNTFDEFGRQAMHWLTMGQVASNTFNARGQLWKQYDCKGQWTEFVYDNFGRTAAKFLFPAGGQYPSNSVCYIYNQLGQLSEIVECYGADATTNACNGYAALVGLPKDNSGIGVKLMASVNSSPNTTGGAMAMSLLALMVALVPQEKRRQFARCLVQVWQMQRELLVGVQASACSRRRLRMPSLIWRAASVISLLALLASEPGFDQLWTAHAQCNIPSNASTPTTRITNFAYDVDGHLTQVNCPEGVINYSYDMATGRLTSTCTANSYVAYGYDALGRLATVTVSKRNGVAVNETTTYGYDAVGNRSSVQLPNGVVTTYLYDSLNRLTNLTHQAGTTNLASYSYNLSASGRRTNAVEILRQEDGTYLTNTLAWQFDGMYRLTNEVSVSMSPDGNYAYTNAYQYDLAGNRLAQVKTGTSVTTVTNDYDANDELLQEVSLLNGSLTGTNSYAYDLNGSVIGKTNSSGTVTYTYNVANKLNGVWQNGTLAASYLYNDQGIRVSQTANGGNTTHYLIDENNQTGYAQILEELATVGGTPSMSYVMGDEVLAQCGATATAPSYYLPDGHGSNRQLTQMNGTVTSHYSYDAYGAVQPNTSSSTAEYAVNNNITSKLYCGEQYDSNLQMYNLRARYYNPANGRFNQRDTFAGNNDDPQTLHKYLYCGADPVNNLDQNGLQFSMIEILVVSGTIGILSADVALACGASYKTAIYVGLLAALITAAIMLAIVYLPEIIQWVRTMWNYQLANRTVSNQLFKKMIDTIGEDATVEQKLAFFAENEGLGPWLEGLIGYGQKLLELFVNPGAFIKWAVPTPAGAVGLAAVLIYVYRNNIKQLFDDLTEAQKQN